MQGSVIEGIENLRPMPPDNRVSVKMTDCISDYCNLNNRTLDMVNDIGFIRVMAAANPRYQFYSRTYMTKTKLPLRYAAAVQSTVYGKKSDPGRRASFWGALLSVHFRGDFFGRAFFTVRSKIAKFFGTF